MGSNLEHGWGTLQQRPPPPPQTQIQVQWVQDEWCFLWRHFYDQSLTSPCHRWCWLSCWSWCQNTFGSFPCRHNSFSWPQLMPGLCFGCGTYTGTWWGRYDRQGSSWWRLRWGLRWHPQWCSHAASWRRHWCWLSWCTLGQHSFDVSLHGLQQHLPLLLRLLVTFEEMLPGLDQQFRSHWQLVQVHLLCLLEHFFHFLRGDRHSLWWSMSNLLWQWHQCFGDGLPSLLIHFLFRSRLRGGHPEPHREQNYLAPMQCTHPQLSPGSTPSSYARTWGWAWTQETLDRVVMSRTSAPEVWTSCRASLPDTCCTHQCCFSSCWLSCFRRASPRVWLRGSRRCGACPSWHTGQQSQHLWMRFFCLPSGMASTDATDSWLNWGVWVCCFQPPSPSLGGTLSHGVAHHHPIPVCHGDKPHCLPCSYPWISCRWKFVLRKHWNGMFRDKCGQIHIEQRSLLRSGKCTSCWQHVPA